MFKWIIAIVVVMLLIFGVYYVMHKDTSQEQDTSGNAESQQFDETNAVNLQTSDDDFNEIESSIDFLE